MKAPEYPDKAAAIERWRRVSRKELDPATIDWLAGVAAGLLVAAAEKDANRRRQAALNATGLAGRGGLDSYVAQVMVAAAESVPDLTSKERARHRRAMVALGANLPLETKQEIGAEALRKRVERARKKL